MAVYPSTDEGAFLVVALTDSTSFVKNRPCVMLSDHRKRSPLDVQKAKDDW